MSLISILAIYFIVWWVTLFAVLPIGVTTGGDGDAVTRGTRGSAPDAPRMGLKVVLTSIIAAVIVAIFYVVTVTFGWSVDDIPRIVPEFSRGAE